MMLKIDIGAIDKMEVLKQNESAVQTTFLLGVPMHPLFTSKHFRALLRKVYNKF